MNKKCGMEKYFVTGHEAENRAQSLSLLYIHLDTGPHSFKNLIKPYK